MPYVDTILATLWWRPTPGRARASRRSRRLNGSLSSARCPTQSSPRLHPAFARYDRHRHVSWGFVWVVEVDLLTSERVDRMIVYPSVFDVFDRVFSRNLPLQAVSGTSIARTLVTYNQNIFQKGGSFFVYSTSGGGEDMTHNAQPEYCSTILLQFNPAPQYSKIFRYVLHDLFSFRA